MEAFFKALFQCLDSPIAVVLCLMIFLETGALVWMSKMLSKERNFSNVYATELTKNTKVLQELADMIKILVLGRR